MRNKIILISIGLNIILFILVLFSFKSSEIAPLPQKYFIAEYTLGSGWNKKLDYEKQEYSGHHSRFLSSLRSKDVIDFGARYSDKGIIILKSTDLNAAKNLLGSDTAVAKELFNVDVNELSVFYPGYINNTPADPEALKNKKVTGIGGLFFKSKDPKTLKAWYQKHLGMHMDAYGSAFEWREGEDPSKYGFTQWGVFPEATKYFEPSGKEFMINYRVKNLVSLVEELKKEGVQIVDTMETYEYGSFIHIMDPEGNKIELWEPVDAEFDKIVEGRTK